MTLLMVFSSYIELATKQYRVEIILSSWSNVLSSGYSQQAQICLDAVCIARELRKLHNLPLAFYFSVLSSSSLQLSWNTMASSRTQQEVL
jgi:hypothetical protein